MAAYVLVQVTVHDPDNFVEYLDKVHDVVESFGGEYLASGPDYEVLEGDWALDASLVLKFPSVEAAKRWHSSEEYKPLLAMRQKYASSNLIVIDGV